MSELSYDLSGLQITQFDLCQANVRIVGGEGPRLELSDNAFEHRFDNGYLYVKEHVQKKKTVLPPGTVFGNSIFTQGATVFGDVIYGDKMVVYGSEMGRSPDGESSPPTATLYVPAEHRASHAVDSTRGSNIEVSGIGARLLRLSTRDGGVLLEGVVSSSLSVRTYNGSIAMRRVMAEVRPKIQSYNGTITMNECSAPAWKVETYNGNVDYRYVEGDFQPYTYNGSVRHF